MTAPAKPRAAVLTLGCKVNQFESSSLSESLAQAGYEVADRPVGVDLVVINTCTVTQKADQEALALVRRLKRHNPAAHIVATGCLAQSNPGLLAETGLVSMVLGQDEKAHLMSHLADLDSLGGGLVRVAEPTGPAGDFGAPAPEKTRAFFKIQDGCSACCAYCAVPHSRGPSRSLDLDRVLEGLRTYLVRGLGEVVLCGIHLGQWGRDFSAPMTLAELIHTIGGEIAPDEETFRLRLSSIEPLEVESSLIETFEMYPWLAPHFHLPLQSGSDRVLSLMGRPYRAAQFRALVESLIAQWPLAGLGVDVMAGFPGETEEDFRATYELLESLPLTYFHVFPYSRRPGTRAAESPQQIPEHLKRARVLELKTLNQAKRKSFALRNHGRRETGLVENTPHRLSGRLKALTGNYLSVLLPENFTAPPATLLPLEISESRNQWGLLEGTPVF